MATTPAHTAGPWTAERVYLTRNEPDMRVVKHDAHGNVYLLIADTRHSEDPKYTCFVQKVEEMKANAYLIAAAPDLLDALQALSDYAVEFTYLADEVDGQRMIQKARAAIEKALGNTAIEHSEV